MKDGRRNDASKSGEGSEQEDTKLQRLSQVHVLRYIAELTEEMSRLAGDHQCAELSDDLSAIARKARRTIAKAT